MKNYFLTGLLLMIIVSCSKDTFQSKPQLTLKSVSSNVVPVNSGFQVTMRLTDKEGDFYDTIWVPNTRRRPPHQQF
jgi:hypothetical protein